MEKILAKGTLRELFPQKRCQPLLLRLLQHDEFLSCSDGSLCGTAVYFSGIGLKSVSYIIAEKYSANFACIFLLWLGWALSVWPVEGYKA